MPGRQPRLHLPWAEWPSEDRRLWDAAIGSDDPFDDAAGSTSRRASRRQYVFAWRRFLGFWRSKSWQPWRSLPLFV